MADFGIMVGHAVFIIWIDFDCLIGINDQLQLLQKFDRFGCFFNTFCIAVRQCLLTFHKPERERVKVRKGVLRD